MRRSRPSSMPPAAAEPLSEATQRQIVEEFETEFIDSVTVKGKTEPVNTYKLTGRKGSDFVKGWS